jgi:ribosome-binding protein aMBF1 (putative translation factor)
MKAVQMVVLGGKEYVILPKADYLRLNKSRSAVRPGGGVDALAHADATIGANLKRAREAAALTQEQLAERLGKSQAMVSGAESGRVRVSARYVASVVKACGLPEGWPASPTTKPRRAARRKVA